MLEVLLGAVGFVLVGGAFAFGFLFGYAGGRGSGRRWIEENGCYTCQEKAKNPFEL